MVTRLGLVLLVGTSALAAGCATSRAERRADQATFRAAMHEHRAAQLEVENAQLRTAAAVQQVLFVQSLVAQVRSSSSSVAVAPVCEGAPASRPLIDAVGEPVPVLSDEPTVRDIVIRMEAVLGRPLRPQERLQVAQLLRRPRA